MKPIRYSLYILLLPFIVSAQTGDNWTLQRSVQYALENNLQVKRLNNSTELARLQVQQGRNNRLPTLNGGTGVNLQLGRTIDPTTNSFEAQNIFSQGYQLQGGLTIYNGGLIKNSLRQAEIDLDAAQTDARITGNDIALQVANSYLTILLLREQLANAQAQLALTTDQLDNIDVQIRAGSVAAAQRYDLVAQQAANQSTVIDLDNQAEIAKLNLQLLLELDPKQTFSVVTPVRDFAEEQLMLDYDVEEVFQAARQTQPTVRAAELRRTSAEVGKEIARAGLRPTVSLFASLSTNYSNLGKDRTNPDFSEAVEVANDPVPVIIGDGTTPTQLTTFFLDGIVLPNLGYFQQLDQNFGQSIGFNVSVPIYNQGRNKINIQRAEVQRLGAEIEIEQANNTLRSDVERALGDLRAARESYRAAQISQEAAENAYEVAQRRFNAGAANNLDLITATNRLEQARTSFTRTKYQLIFNREVIQFYLGQGLSLD